jgi:probable rRNA maturation factor
MIDFQNNICEQIVLDDFLAVYDELANDKDLELIIVNNELIRALNLEHRSIDKETDVLSFPVEFEFANFLGSIVISYEYADKLSKELGHSLQDEMKLLFLHGLLHLLGFDHEVDIGEMRAEESRIIEKLGLPLSLIVRND